ncbi:hypothetical protein [Deinococcus cellulosilyticus]|uniref:Uncharacterized protein n=1 Tax=Deinococcus cellulosilyticus (strain DSM 18568 / NBRC 106333 / KACC 11606 / 5516J-15) TaxID=1223518 RepID=A0A511N3R8_DEIC1|nr:hypothetical protein [Deinococcus cellulosilyticus]GEM47513.1 hypothetical protein DC3_31480 [Deinococcus cellulosilyticus NBRC 106333 = KACC 11606]
MSTQKRIEQYLNQATRGLWGKQRMAVRQELHSHIFERMQHHLAFGVSADEALARALQALGKPAEINAGLLKTHTLPVVTRSLLIAGLMGGLLVSQAHNQKMVGFHQKMKLCTISTCSEGPITYFEADGLMKTLREQNVPATLRVEPDGGALLLLPEMHSTYFSPLNTVQKDGKIYLSFDELVTSLSIETAFNIRHLKNPEITFNTTTFRVGDEKHPFDATSTYRHLIAPSIYNQTGATVVWGPAASAIQTHALNIRRPAAAEGEVYALLQPAPANLYNTSVFEKAYTLQFSEVQKGTLHFKSATPQVNFTTLDARKPGSVVLKITGKINYWKSLPPYEVVQPSENHIFYP